MKLTLSDVAAGYNLQNINDNFNLIATAINDYVLFRNNPVGEPNALETSVDANGQVIYNLPEPTLESQAARLKDVQNALLGNSQANLIGFTPGGTVSSTNVQAAIMEVAAEVAGVTDLTPSSTMAGIGGGLQIVNNLSGLRSVSKFSPANRVLVLGSNNVGDGGNGLFYIDLADTVSADNNSTVIVGVDAGRWKIIQNNTMSVAQFGATGAAAKIQSAIAQRGVYRIPAGTHAIDTQLNVDYSVAGFPNEYVMGARVSMSGEALHNTMLNYSGAADTTAIRLKGSGPSVFGVHAYDMFSDFTLKDATDSNTRNGIYAENRAFFELKRMNIHRFKTGLQMNACLSSTFERLTFAYNTNGLILTNDSGNSLPNALTFTDCQWDANSNAAVLGNIVGATNTFRNCRFEHNGVAGGVATGGLFLNLSGLNGTACLTMDSCYFEGNGGLSDLYLTNVSGNHLTVILRGCTFNRISNTKFVTNNITVGNTGGGTVRVVMEGCSFVSAGSYVPDAARKFISVDSATEVIDIGCTYNDTVGLGTNGANYPAAGTTYGGKVNGDGTKLMGSTGISITKIGIGAYQVTRGGSGFAKHIDGYVPIAVCSFTGGSRKVERVQADSAVTFTVVITDNAGVQQDGSFHWTALRLA
jgi:hypothetical protein